MANTLIERTSSRTLPTLLTVDNRCDGCGSQAYALTSDGLLWCGHHLTQHRGRPGLGRRRHPHRRPGPDRPRTGLSPRASDRRCRQFHARCRVCADVEVDAGRARRRVDVQQVRETFREPQPAPSGCFRVRGPDLGSGEGVVAVLDVEDELVVGALDPQVPAPAPVDDRVDGDLVDGEDDVGGAARREIGDSAPRWPGPTPGRPARSRGASPARVRMRGSPHDECASARRPRTLVPRRPDATEHGERTRGRWRTARSPLPRRSAGVEQRSVPDRGGSRQRTAPKFRDPPTPSVGHPQVRDEGNSCSITSWPGPGAAASPRSSSWPSGSPDTAPRSMPALSTGCRTAWSRARTPSCVS